jgi:hypothetical protein
MASGSHAIYTGSATCLATCLPICLAVHTGHVLTNTGNQGPPFVLVAWRWPRPNFLVLDHSIIVALKLPRLVRLLWRRQNWSILGICDDLFDDGRVLGTKDHDLTIPQTSEHRRNSFSSSEWTYLFLRCCWEGRSHIVGKAVAPSFSMPEQPGHTTPHFAHLQSAIFHKPHVRPDCPTFAAPGTITTSTSPAETPFW